jgi:RNA polymerase-binding protein DksA
MGRMIPDADEIRSRLHRRREALVQRVEQELDAENELVAERDADWEDLAARHGVADLLDRFSERDRRELARIDAAMRRVDEGTYGHCTSCGRQIAVDRLLALPDADLCTDCADRELRTAVV